MSEKKLHLKNLKKSFKGRIVVDIENLVLGSHGIEGLIGPNGAGKTTLMSLITNKLSLDQGQVLFYPNKEAIDITNKKQDEIARYGVVKTNQIIQDFESLTIKDSLLLAIAAPKYEKIFNFFSEEDLLREAKNEIDEYLDYFHFEDPDNYALSAGEKKLLDIIRCLLLKPKFLLMDEPTAGLPEDQTKKVMDLMKKKTKEEAMSILIVEHNLDLIWEVSERVHFMAEGKILLEGSPEEIKADKTVALKYMGESDPVLTIEEPITQESSNELLETSFIKQVDPLQKEQLNAEYNRSYVPPTRWSKASWEINSKGADKSPLKSRTTVLRPFDDKIEPLLKARDKRFESLRNDEIIVAGTFDTKAIELNYIRDQILLHGLNVRRVDLSTSSKLSSVEVPPHMVAAYHPRGTNAVFNGDRDTSLKAMSEAFVNWLKKYNRCAAIISAAGSAGTSLVTPAMQSLPVGIPKLMISTVASGSVGQYVGPTDIMMMNSVIDIQGLNQISEQILANGANAIAGMVKNIKKTKENRLSELVKPAIGLTMYDMTKPAIEKITSELKNRYDCLVFHAIGTSGQSMEKLVNSGTLNTVIDLTTTEISDMMMGGVFAENEDRFSSFIRNRIPYVGSVGALDMVKFGSRDSVPESYSKRKFVEQNPSITLIRTSVEENIRMGKWIAERINKMTGPVRFLIPEAGVSSLDQKGQAFFDPEADRALFDAISQQFEESANHRLIHTPYHINDDDFSRAIIDSLDEINPEQMKYQYASA